MIQLRQPHQRRMHGGVEGFVFGGGVSGKHATSPNGPASFGRILLHIWRRRGSETVLMKGEGGEKSGQAEMPGEAAGQKGRKGKGEGVTGGWRVIGYIQR